VVLLQMHLSCDRRTWTQQATSGVKIAGAIVATAAALGLIASAYIRIARLDGGNHVTAGWLLLAAVTIVLSATVSIGVAGSISCPATLPCVHPSGWSCAGSPLEDSFLSCSPFWWQWWQSWASDSASWKGSVRVTALLWCSHALAS